MRLVITDSGLGGLSVCAALEHATRHRPGSTRVHMTYVNAWPEDGRGYNDLPDTASRAAVFDNALGSIAALRPDRLLIACNTLSILYPATRFSRTPPFPVVGIVDAGVSLFREALEAEPDSSIALLGTKTTIASGAHRDALVASGVDHGRIVGVPCHGLATVIERDIGGPGVGTLIGDCGRAVTAAHPSGNTVLVGLCCTHYGYVGDRIARELARALGRRVLALDPNQRMVRDVSAALGLVTGEGTAAEASLVEVVSKVTLDERTCRGVAGLVRPTSPATADALLAYRHVPSLF
ncbi:MAG: aspartate/glutamate racemase family protein [Vicinamibacterales bacterium]|nr:aspartate/glutamate racemase family protein [Vicinamibacterales bacterium]